GSADGGSADGGSADGGSTDGGHGGDGGATVTGGEVKGEGCACGRKDGGGAALLWVPLLGLGSLLRRRRR
ncbi:MAG: hypothetical protein D6798_17370, partial [Deltaproteobacteria bacterium]